MRLSVAATAESSIALDDSPQRKAAAVVHKSIEESTAPFKKTIVRFGAGVVFRCIWWDCLQRLQRLDRGCNCKAHRGAHSGRKPYTAGPRAVSVPTHFKGEIGQLASGLEQMNRKIAKREAEILRLAFVDPLTHLANRVGLIKETAKLHATSHGSGSVAIEMIDIEHLQHINDGLGYSVGDQVINEVAQRSRRLAAPDEVTARIDGGLYAWLLHGASDTLIAARMRELVEHFANNATIIADHAIDITVHVGWALS